MMKFRNTFIGLSWAVCIVSSFYIGVITHAFFDEIASLKQELAAWEVAHAADFSEVIDQLEDMSGSAFIDVTSNDWFFKFVIALEEWQIVNGVRDSSGKLTGEYRPANSVTVAEALKMAINAAQENDDDCFEGEADHPEASNHWAKEYVICGEKLGIRLLDSRYLASLDRNISRSEVLTIIHDSFGDEIINFRSSFKDSQGHPFESDIAYAALFGVVSGDKNDTGVEIGIFRPNDLINRAEVAKVIYNKVRQEVANEVL